MSQSTSAWPNPLQTSTDPGRDPLEARWDDDDEDADQEGDDVDAERQAEYERRADQAEGAAEQGGQGDEPRADAAELDPQLERAEGEGMVTEHAKVSATDPGPEPLPEPEPDHGPSDPEWELGDERE